MTHLFFVDDNLLFFQATPQDCALVKQCLQLYEKASGQMINFDKSALTFSPAAVSHHVTANKTMLGISVVDDHELYLGLPTFSL